MATNSGTLSAPGDTALLILADRDNRATVHLDGSYNGLVVWSEASNEGNNYDLVTPLRLLGRVWEVLTPTRGFAVPDASSMAWEIDLDNRRAVRFRVQSLSGTVNWRIDSSFVLTGLPPALSAPGISDGLAPALINVQGVGLYNRQSGLFDRLASDGTGAARVQADDLRRLDALYLEHWRCRKLLETIANENYDSEFPPDWEG